MALQPGVVLLLFHSTDFDNNLHTQQYWYFKPAFTVDGGELELNNVPVRTATIRQRLDRFFLGRTFLGFRAQRLFRRRFLVDGGSESLPAGSRELTHRIIRAVNELCRQNGVVFMVASVPMNAEQRAFLHRVAEEEQIHYLPLGPHFDTVTDPVVFPTDSHWNAFGHETAAAAIESFLHEIHRLE